jgi:hypothetical protein
VVCGAALVGCGNGLDTTESFYSGADRPPVPVRPARGEGIMISDTGIRNANLSFTGNQNFQISGTEMTIWNNSTMAHTFVSADCPGLALGTVAAGGSLMVTLPSGWLQCTLSDPTQTSGRFQRIVLSNAENIER